MNIKKISVTLAAGLMFFGGPLVSGSMVASADSTVSEQQVEQTYYISNAQFFEAFYNQGINVEQILGEAEYKEALAEDMLARGGTYIKGSKQGFTLYLNSAVCKVIFWGGAGAAGTAIAGLLASVGLAPAAIGAVSSIVGGTIGTLGMKATTRGVWFQFKQNILVNYGFQ